MEMVLTTGMGSCFSRYTGNMDEEPLKVPIEDAIDLHTFRPEETRDLVLDYLEEASRRGFREVRIIHGRGIGVQREIVRSVLSNSPLVLSFRDAEPGGGGWGATVATLRKDPLSP